MRIRWGSASVSVHKFEGGLYIQDLRGGLSVGELVGLAKKIREVTIGTDVYFPLGDGEVYEKLRRIARRMGATKQFEVWRLTNGD